MKVIKLEIREEDIELALKKALSTNYIDNLRDRNSFVRLDSSIRGCLGEIGITRWFEENNIIFESTNLIINNSEIDLDLLYINELNEKIVVEVKTSLIPDVWGSLENTLKNADIKIIKRNENVLLDTHGDFHIQIYFNMLTKKRDRFLEELDVEIGSLANSEIIDLLKLRDYKQAFVSWIDIKSLAKYLETQSTKTWSFGYRKFWRCPIIEVGKYPEDIIEGLKKYNKN